MVKKPKNSITLQIAIAAGLSGIIIFLLIIIGLDTKKVANDIIETRTEIHTRNKQAQNIAQLREEAAKAEERQKILNNVLPQKDELFSFSDEITAIGANSNVNTNFSFGSEGEKQIGYSIVGTGNYSNIVDFLKTLEDDVAFIYISSFNLVLGDAGYDVNLSGSVFFNEQE